MKARINSYFAILLITIAGAGATMLIVHVATADTFTILTSHGEYAPLERSILNQ